MGIVNVVGKPENDRGEESHGNHRQPNGCQSAGHPETAEEGMAREIKEETGLCISPEHVVYMFSVPNIYN